MLKVAMLTPIISGIFKSILKILVHNAYHVANFLNFSKTFKLLQFAWVEADKRANNQVGTVLLDILYNIKTSSNIAYMSALIKTMRVIPASQGGLSRRQAHGDFFQKNLHKMFPVWEREWVLWSHL